MIHWANRNHARIELEGECGIMRECVGLIVEGVYPDYEWHDEDYERVDTNGDVWRPEGAYHKHPCVAVLGRGEGPEAQLYDWLTWFVKNGFTIVTGDIEPPDGQCWDALNILMGNHKYSRMARQTEPDKLKEANEKTH